MDAQILSFFKFEHLPPGVLQITSKRFHDLAFDLVSTIPASFERTAMLRKLLEAKDCAVRSWLMPADLIAPRSGEDE